jgi:hypothetical protein
MIELKVYESPRRQSVAEPVTGVTIATLDRNSWPSPDHKCVSESHWDDFPNDSLFYSLSFLRVPIGYYL